MEVPPRVECFVVHAVRVILILVGDAKGSERTLFTSLLMIWGDGGES